MVLHTFDCDWSNFLSNQSRQAFVQGEAKNTHAFLAKTERRSQYEVRAVRFQKIGGTNIGLKMFRDQRDDVHKSLRRLVGILREVRNFIQCQNVIDLAPLHQWTGRLELIVILSPIFLYLQNTPTQLLTIENLNRVSFLPLLVQRNVPECRRSARY